MDTNKTKGESLKKALDQLYGEQSTLFLHCNVESEEKIKGNTHSLVAVVRFTYLALEHMNEMTGGQGGVIVNTASMAGLSPAKSCPFYTATKHGVVGFTRAMAASSTAAGYGVRFNAVCPGFVQTELLTSLSNKLGQFSQLADEFQRNAEKSTLTVSEVADCLLELVTDETKNGETLQIRYNGKKYMTFPVFT
ncbi:hypothetical protein F7725_006971 [Dissostichus mawsoni]|uniref:Uncharacterized protein n=1 Tax=Dissostichus mawsoni TaxID=36200 RepID=A0A7J5XX59_DISMA|nr:hypothetical protein F7725_006971 [Dissostichus mawsoni]